MLKYTIVPASFFKKESLYQILSEAVQLSEQDKISYKELPQYKAVLVYAYKGDKNIAPEIAGLVEATRLIKDHNKVAATYHDGFVNIAIATDKKLLLANSYPATEAVTAEYFIFAALKQFQMNPQVTTIYIGEPVCGEMTDDFIRYFKGVETL